MATLQDVQQLIEQNPDICYAGRPASSELIDEAERFLGLQFPHEYREFLQRWGTLAIGSLEFYGICGEDFVNSSAPDAIWYTKRERQYGLSKELVVLFDNNGDEYYCLDTRDTQRARVVVWDAIAREVSGVKANSLFDFILGEATDSI